MVSCFIVFSSCDKAFIGKKFPDVDFNNITDVQLTYRQNIYNIKLSLSSDTLTISFLGNNTSLDGMSYAVDSEFCRISYCGLVHNVSVDNLPESFLPIVIYNFIFDFGGIVPTENYNSQRACSYITRTVSGISVTLEVYENEDNIAYSLHII